MRKAVLGLFAPLCLLAFSAQAQETWQFDSDAVDGPTASITEGDYIIGGFCDEGDYYFFADFPRTGMPKEEDGTVRFKFTKDAPSDSPTFNVSMVTRGWDLVGEKASVWFRGQVADNWIEDMRIAQNNLFIAVETDEDTPRLIVEHVFSVRGSTAAINTLLAECEA